jgi:hypothetical protein
MMRKEECWYAAEVLSRSSACFSSGKSTGCSLHVGTSGFLRKRLEDSGKICLASTASIDWRMTGGGIALLSIQA